MVLVDSNILIDVFTDDPKWQPWSATQLASVAEREDLAINPAIYAELAAGFERESQLERALKPWPLTRLALVYRRLQGRAGISTLSPRGRNAPLTPARLLYRRPCGIRTPALADARSGTVSALLSQAAIARA